MNKIEKNRTEEIKDLHERFIETFKKTLDYGIRIGELLMQQKSDLKHGQFGSWIEKNLPFTDRTARNYMRLYRKRDALKTETVSDLTSAYRLLTAPKPLEGWKKTIHCYASCVNTTKEELNCSWENAFNELVEETGFPLNVLLNWHYYFFGAVSDELLPKPITDEEHEQTGNAIQQIYEKRKEKPQQSKRDEKTIYCR